MGIMFCIGNESFLGFRNISILGF